MEDIKTIITALRCSSTISPACSRDCKYYRTESAEDIEPFLKSQGLTRDMLPDDFFSECDCDQIALDAADALEELSK